MPWLTTISLARCLGTKFHGSEDEEILRKGVGVSPFSEVGAYSGLPNGARRLRASTTLQLKDLFGYGSAHFGFGRRLDWAHIAGCDMYSLWAGQSSYRALKMAQGVDFPPGPSKFLISFTASGKTSVQDSRCGIPVSLGQAKWHPTVPPVFPC